MTAKQIMPNAICPLPVKGAHEIAKLTTAVGATIVSAITPAAAPALAISVPILNYLIDQYRRRGERILLRKLDENG